MNEENNGGTKFDSDKLRMDLLPPDVLKAVAEILTHGSKKYGDRNWEKGMQWSRPIAALLRHLVAFMSGEDIDPDSGLSHIDHALCNCMFLSAYSRRGIGVDDRPII